MHCESVSCSDPTKFKPNSDSMHRFDEINGIDSQMIAKDKTRILLYKDCVVSHSASLEDKQRI